MHDIHIADPAWRTTFPYLVAPLPNEWIAGVLLRCDERNFWGSGTTLGYVLRPGSKQSAMNELSTIVPTVIDLEKLSHVLSVSVPRIVATTYLAELARLYGSQHLHAQLLSCRLRSMCVQRALPRNGNLLVGSPYRTSCTVQNIISLSSVLVHVEQLCNYFIENHSHLPVPSAALIGKTFRTSKETLHEWKRSNNSSPPTNFF